MFYAEWKCNYDIEVSIENIREIPCSGKFKSISWKKYNHTGVGMGAGIGDDGVKGIRGMGGGQGWGDGRRRGAGGGVGEVEVGVGK